MYSFEDLDVWKHSRKLRNRISRIAATFPKEETYRLKDQILRSSRSIGTNIAEGFGRYHYQENIQFCRIARGSLAETVDHLFICRDEEYIDEEIFNSLYDDCTRLLKILNGYIKYLGKAKKNKNP